MKVFIGGYKDYFGPYQIAEKLLFWKDSNSDDVFRLGNFLAGENNSSWISKLCSWIESKRSRTVKVKIHDYDVWSMDTTLAYIILPMLKKLKEKKQGVPYSPIMDYASTQTSQASFDFYSESDDIVFEAASKDWDEKLDKMIYSFEHFNYEHLLSDSTDDDDNDYSYDFAKDKDVQDKVHEGLILFGTHYQSLWY